MAGLDFSPLKRAVDAVAGDATPAELAYQVAAAVAALALAWIIARALSRGVTKSRKWTFGKGDFEGVAFPLLALAFLWGAAAFLMRSQDVELIEVGVTLLIAYAVTRAAVYVLGHVVPEGGLQPVVIRVVKWAAWIAAVLYVTGLLPEFLATLDSHGFTFGRNRTEITILDLLKGVAALFLTIVFALWLSRVTESRVMSAESMEVTTRVVISKVVRIAVAFIAVFIALPMAGIDVTTLSVFTGALGVGLGFGLQKIVSNYVSGFIVLLERSVRIGDVIMVDGRRGEVKGIESRYTVIKGADGVESIIPNEKLVTESVNHHTYSDPKVSLLMSVWIAYESDVDRACALLGEIARGHRRVVAEPAAMARIKQLGDHGIELELTVWISDPAVGEGELKSDLFKDILKRFRAASIEIPYPRRDVRLIATPETKNISSTSGT